MKKLLTLILPLCSVMQMEAQDSTPSKFAFFYRNMVGTDAGHLDFSQQGTDDAWAPGHTYYNHKDLSQLEYVTRYVRCKDFGVTERSVTLTQADTKDVDLFFTPKETVKQYISRIVGTTNNRVATAERIEGNKIRISAIGAGTCQIILHHEEAGDRKIQVTVLPDEAYVDRTVDSLLNLMTQDEKLKYLGGTNWFYTQAIDRLDIPQLRMCDGPQGVGGGTGPSTAYPSDLALTATWNRDLANRYGVSLARDCRARGIHIILGPAVNIYRSPLCGRNFEYMGEDPYLAAQTSTQYIKGVQSQGVSATIKHFMGNNSDYNRDYISNDMDDRTMHEIYLPTFKAAVQEANTGAVMSSYNLVNGEYTTHSHKLLTEILRDKWGFKGILMSDWGSTHDGLEAAKGGLDLEMAGASNMTPNNLRNWINQGKITWETVNTKVRHILYTLVRMGFMNGSQEDTSISLDDPTSDETALEVARECMVLLKNKDNILPLDAEKFHNIVITGKNATGYVRGGGSGSVNPTHYVDMVEGIQLAAEKTGAKVEYRDALDFLPAIMYTSEDLSEHGFIAKYYNNTNVSGNPVGTRVETKINHIWSGMTPEIGNLGSSNYSVSWEGVMSPSSPGTYTFTLGGDDGYRLIINGETVIDGWKASAYHSNTYSKRLVSGQKYDIKVQYFQEGGDARVDFTWKKNSDDTDYMVEYLKQADLVVACLGFNSVSEGEGHDRDFNLDNDDKATIESIRKSGTPAIVFLNGGGSMDIASWESIANGLLWIGYAGQQAGTAAGEILFGETNPSGHLPVTFERRYTDNPVYNNYWDPDGDKHVEYKEGIFVGYRGYDRLNRTVQYPFGHGLSYTTFSLTDMNVGEAQADGSVPVTCKLTNTGDREGSQVVQVYVGRQGGDVERPVRELKQYEKVSLKPGESRQLTISLPKSSFTYYDQEVANDFVYDPGEYKIELGFSSRDIQCDQSITLK